MIMYYVVYNLCDSSEMICGELERTTKPPITNILFGHVNKRVPVLKEWRHTVV